MKRMTASTYAAATLIVIGTAAVSGAGISAAASRHSAASKPTKATATFQMFANVDAEGDLGSNYDAKSAEILPGSSIYRVTFKKPIGSCAGIAQVGKAGGPDASTPATPIVTNATKKSFDIEFDTNESGGSIGLHHEPFMMTVTCQS